jgi:hypothetical protein
LLRNKIELNDCFTKAALISEDLTTKAASSLNNNIIDKETYNLFTALFEGLGAQLEALQLLAGEIEALPANS